ncbi:hypothetical protein MNBD_GAMMA07-1305 [hydrothermal vent metagenome]|uniref:RDD domain-containing protein n=1 Tax=hydrothermal vent metagenome TaxID=652676 RepID=A0A3B0XHI1_9ZZZZ
MPDSPSHRPVTLFKRLLSIIYDLILLTAMCFSVAAIVSIFTTFIFNDGNAITEAHPFYLINQILILSTIFITGFLFYVWFWSHGGQSLGMKTWMLMLVSNDGNTINKKQAAIRALAAVLSWCCFGLGFLWSLVDARKRTWHDILSASHLIQLEKK